MIYRKISDHFNGHSQCTQGIRLQLWRFTDLVPRGLDTETARFSAERRLNLRILAKTRRGLTRPRPSVVTSEVGKKSAMFALSGSAWTNADFIVIVRQDGDCCTTR